MVIILEYLDVQSELVAIDTYVNWMPGISISQGIDKVTFDFQLALVGIFGIVPY